MKDCTHYRRMIERRLADELTETERKELDRHAEACADCAALVALHRELLDAGEEIPAPAPMDLRNMRDEVLARIADEGRPAGAPSFRRSLASLFSLHAAPAAAGLILLLALAWFAGARTSAPAALDDARLLAAIEAQAARSAGLDAYWDTPFSYGNVDARRRADGSLALSFDVSRHVDLVTAADSPLARDVLLHAILEPAPVGARLRAMTLSQASDDARLAEALALALHNDPSEVIRLKALELLDRRPGDAGVQAALLTTLQTDPSVRMRLLALESLARRRVPGGELRSAIETADLESDRALMQRADELIRGF